MERWSILLQIDLLQHRIDDGLRRRLDDRVTDPPTAGSRNQRRGMIIGSQNLEGYTVVDSEVPLTEMFGYSTDLRSATQGKGEFTMEFLKYSPVPRNVRGQ